MTDSELWAAWGLWMAVAGAVVLVAAALLVTIWLTARSILEHARRALAAAEKIRANTEAVWELQATNDAAEGLLAAVASIERKAGALVMALASPAGSRERRRA